MPSPLDNYFQRINPTLKRPEEGAARLPSVDLYKAWDGLSRAMFVTAPNALDRVRVTRNKFVPTVRNG